MLIWQQAKCSAHDDEDMMGPMKKFLTENVMPVLSNRTAWANAL